jgi:site-specific recombinase
MLFGKRTSHVPGGWSKQAATRLDELTDFAQTEGYQEERVLWLIELVNWLRPNANQRGSAKIAFLENQLSRNPERQKNVSVAMSELVRRCGVSELLAYGGIPRDFHLAGAVKEWFLARVLPAACNTDDAEQIVCLAFKQGDVSWIARGGIASLLRQIIDPSLAPEILQQVKDAITNLTHQIVAQAHSPNVRSLAREERSPFNGLPNAIAELIADPQNESHLPALRGRAKQCRLLVESHRAELVERGADLNTTFQLVRLEQQLDRLVLLAELLHEPSDRMIGRVCTVIVKAVLHNVTGKSLFARSSDLLLQNLVETAASVGRDYLDEEKSSFRAAFGAGAGGGALMAVATVIKYFLIGKHFPPLYEGIVFSINYATAFCVAYLFHFTIATKLPAHTAAALAESVRGAGAHRVRIALFLRVWRATVRLQFAGLLGNIVVAAPLAFAFDVVAKRALGHHLLGAQTAEHALASNSILGPSILFAALTGFFLWLSSLIGAAGDNWTRVIGLSDRLATNVTAMKRLGVRRARPLAEAFVHRVGGMLGNISLGIMLGGIPALFAIASIPVEIRHVTVSTSSVALAFAAGAGSRAELWLAIVGVLVIGAVNVAVSFFLALWLALRSTKIGRSEDSARLLVRVGLRYWLSGARPSASLADPAAFDATSARPHES